MAEVGGLRAVRFCRYLPALGIRPVVLTIDQQCSGRNDDTLPDAPGIHVERTTLFRNPLDVYARLRAGSSQRAAPGQRTRSARSSGGSFLRSPLSALTEALQTPDRFLGWYPAATSAASRLMRKHRIAAMLSTGPAWTAHLIARHLKHRYHLPWLADFRDPWALGNPWRRRRWVHRVDLGMERSCVRHADRVICITESMRQQYAAAYPDLAQSHFVTLTGGFDDIVPPVAMHPQPRRLFVHLGSIYADRRIDTFCDVLDELRNAGKLQEGAFKILFLGETDETAVAVARSRVPELLGNGSIEFRPQTTWRQGQEVLWNADVLLLFQGSHRLQVPAKFFECLATGKPIFAVAEQGALTDLIDRTGSGVWASPGDRTAMAAQFVRAIELASKPRTESQKAVVEDYHYRNLTARLAELVRACADEY